MTCTWTTPSFKSSITLCKQKPSYWEVAIESGIIAVTCKQKKTAIFLDAD